MHRMCAKRFSHLGWGGCVIPPSHQLSFHLHRCHEIDLRKNNLKIKVPLCCTPMDTYLGVSIVIDQKVFICQFIMAKQQGIRR